MRTTIFCAAAMLLALPAAADSYDDTDDNPWHRWHPELSGTIANRDAQLGGIAIHGRQAAVAVAARRARRTTELAYGFGLLPAGVAHELVLRQRHSLVVIGGYSDSLRRGDGWVEAGVGVEVLDASGTGRVSRPIASLGFGADLDFGNTTYDGTPLRYLGAPRCAAATAGPRAAAIASTSASW